jgi:hypothetical protein
MLNTNTDVWYAIRDAMRARQYRGDNRIAINKSGFCEYRLNREVENIGCAIGVLIPDELYSPALERAALDRVRRNSRQRGSNRAGGRSARPRRLAVASR